MQLKEGTLLQNGEYKIIKVLGQGGFGITYLAEQTSLRRKVAIKEFFMKEYCNRDEKTAFLTTPTSGFDVLVKKYKEKFVKEAEKIAQFKHDNIIKIYEVFEEKNTAYYVMEYHDGGSLAEYLSKNGKMTGSVAQRYIKDIAGALSYIHRQKVNHLDVKPSNIMLDSNDKAILIDFGISKHYDSSGNQTSTTPVGISKGYAPLEQYKQGGVSQFSPETDIYSLGATFYNLITGDTPPEADDVNENGLAFPKNIRPSESVKSSIVKAMQPRRKDRPQSVETFLSILNNEIPETNTSIIEKTPHKSKTWIIITLLAIMLGFGGCFAYNIVANKKEKERIETEEKKRQEREMFCNDKQKYLSLIIEGDKLLDKKEYSESVNKYEQAQTYEKKYLYTEYSLEFDKSADNKINAANKAKQEYQAEQARLEKEKQKREAAIKAEEERKAGRINGHEFVDLGLPSEMKWASCNIGAQNPEDYGDYFAWGQVSSSYNYGWNEYNTIKIGGDKNHDAATANWGGSWRMPSKAEFNELIKKCTWEWTTQGGKNGFKVIGPNGNSIFLPVAGYRDGVARYDAGENGCYWTFLPDGDSEYRACYFLFSRYDKRLYNRSRNHKLPIRPVSE